jgi:hypothetical protein
VRVLFRSGTLGVVRAEPHKRLVAQRKIWSIIGAEVVYQLLSAKVEGARRLFGTANKNAVGPRRRARLANGSDNIFNVHICLREGLTAKLALVLVFGANEDMCVGL